jgi:hypothetical protein
MCCSSLHHVWNEEESTNRLPCACSLQPKYIVSVLLEKRCVAQVSTMCGMKKKVFIDYSVRVH